jgi:small subunit ribosomal protein S13
MAIVAGVNIPDNKRLEISLRSVYGIGPVVAKRVATEAGFTDNPRVRDLNEQDMARVRAALDRTGQRIEGDLRREVSGNIRRLIDIQSFRGLRHRRGLPVRGQRTHTNARTRRGRRASVAGRKRTLHK